MNKREKPDCYQCKWRKDLPGSAQSICHIGDGIYGSVFVAEIGKGPKCRPHGVRHGWCNWPFDFDPIWIDDCLFFSRKEEQRNENIEKEGGK